jgi:hypothetical protein
MIPLTGYAAAARPAELARQQLGATHLVPGRAAKRRLRMPRTVTITPAAPKLTSVTDAPGRRRSRSNAVLTHAGRPPRVKAGRKVGSC